MEEAVVEVEVEEEGEEVVEEEGAEEVRYSPMQLKDTLYFNSFFKCLMLSSYHNF